ncbi:hypothetical protein EST38_g3651 [Candolleomyces aberdarensis]|uniref:MINDY deubiquitinase domain-containing protein n=1 Tax=Candolleomyces aberdarensis TaxID=2316362 RepID=A0A4Q2DRJ2_9AGAR|nr:hypothetical protein EST38_g3651 [Candolleomyces aberdarensis]
MSTSEGQASTVQDSVAEVWYLKDVKYGSKDNKQTFKVITQNFNGPCSFIAILLFPEGMDLNPVFTSPTAFRPAGAGGGELKLFQQVGIKLVHGWLVDPDSQESKALDRAPDYDSAASLMAEVDHLTNGRFVLPEEENPFVTAAEAAGSSSRSAETVQPVASSSSSTPPVSSSLSQEQQHKIADAIAVRDFLDHTQSQLTYHGLFQLASTLESNELVALFRNSHLSVLLKVDEPEGAALYTLVTDQVFLREPSVVWEKLEDVDGGWSTFVDSHFLRASPAGGDFAGQTAEDALMAMEMLEQQNRVDAGIDPSDQALARQLQAEEEHLARREQEAYLRHQQRLHEAKSSGKSKKEKPEKKKSKDCIVM